MTPDHLFGLNGKTALVTGGATGIGRMAATGLPAAGARVLITSRKGDLCETVSKEINELNMEGSAEGFSGDVSSEEGINAVITEVKARTDVLNILMNNAGRPGGTLGTFLIPHGKPSCL